MDLQAYSWACGSSIRAISGPETTETEGAEYIKTQPEGTQSAQGAQGLLSLWAAAVHLAAAQGDVEDIEAELGAGAAICVGQEPVPNASDESDDEVVDPHLQDTEKENFSENRRVANICDKKTDAERHTNLENDSRNSVLSLTEVPKDFTVGKDKDAEFLTLLSAWSDDAPASRLLEEARLEAAKVSTRSKRPLHSRIEKPEKAPSKTALERLRSKFPHTRASSPPPESKRWRTQDFNIYFGGEPSGHTVQSIIPNH